MMKPATNTMILTVVALLLGLLTTGLATKRYDGYSVITVIPRELADLEVLASLQKRQDLEIDMFHLPVTLSGRNATFSLPQTQVSDVRQYLEQNKVSSSVFAKDLQSMLDAADSSAAQGTPKSHRKRALRTGDFDFGQYHTHREMNQYIRQVARECSVCKVETIGRSYEDRQMKVIRIGENEPGKRGIWIDAGIHAREWIAPATSLYLVDMLVEVLEGDDSDLRDVVDSFVWYVLPSVNPDGYEFSRTEDRMWRKTRSPNEGNSCIGTDPNRNWDFHWNEVGTSPSPCSPIYAGSRPFSEAETRNMRNTIMRMRRHLSVYLSFHSYGQYWFVPWGYTYEYPEDYEELLAVAEAAEEAVHGVHQKHYQVGSATHLLYPAAGASDDWAKGVADIKYAFTVELRDSGVFGFALPADQIVPTGEEIWAGVVEMARQVRQRLEAESAD